MKNKERDLLTFERIGKYLTGSKDTGYWVIGIILTIAWNSTGFFSILMYGRWLHSPPVVDLSTTMLFFGGLIGLKYLKGIYHSAIYEFKQYIVDKQKFKELYNKKSWWLLFILLIGNQTWWFWNEYSYLHLHPEVVGTLPYRGANLGSSLLVYETIVSIFLFITFVDMLAMIIRVCSFPSKIKDRIQINVFADDKCGGLSKIGQLLLSCAKVYFILLMIGTFGRYFVVTEYPLSIEYYCLITGVAWLFGILIFIAPQYQLHGRMKYLKNEKLRKIHQELKNLVQSHKNKEEDFKRSISILVLFRIKDEIENLREYPFDYTILKNFIFFALLPIFTNILTVGIVEMLL